YICIYMYMYRCVYIYAYMYIYVYVYIYIYICICICIYLYIGSRRGLVVERLTLAQEGPSSNTGMAIGRRQEEHPVSKGFPCSKQSPCLQGNVQACLSGSE